MVDTALIKDIEAAVAIAREGRHTPLLGGQIGLMWTSLATLTLAAHGATYMGWLPIERPQVGFLWLAYGLVGTALSFILSRQIDQKAGANSVLNRAGAYLWTSAGIMIATVAITTVIAYAIGSIPDIGFNFIVPASFGFATVAYATLAGLSSLGYLRFAALASGASAAITLFLVANPMMYFVASGLLLISGVVPSIIELRRGVAQ